MRPRQVKAPSATNSQRQDRHRSQKSVDYNDYVNFLPTKTNSDTSNNSSNSNNNNNDDNNNDDNTRPLLQAEEVAACCKLS